jgi:hypothetical protein
MLTIFSYLTAFLIFMLANKIILALVFIPFKPLVDINKKLQYVASFIYASLASLIGVYLYIIISDNTSLTLSWFMLLIPAIILSIVDHQRIEKAKQGLSGVRFILEANNEPESYDQKIDIRNEQVGCYSRIFGFLLALYLLMAGEPFF